MMMTKTAPTTQEPTWDRSVLTKHWIDGMPWNLSLRPGCRMGSREHRHLLTPSGVYDEDVHSQSFKQEYSPERG